MSSSCAVAIVGATGLVGTTLLNLLETMESSISDVYLLASQHSSNKTIPFKGKSLPIHDLAHFDFSQVDIAFFCVSSELAAKYIPIATKAGAVVIDKSFQYRNHDAVPLIVPEVNLSALSHVKNMNIIANPNCNTIPIAVALKPIYDAVGVSRINIATYQSVSGTGKDAMTELNVQSQQIIDHEAISPSVYPQQIAFNVLPHIDDFQENGYTKEEMKMVWELRKLFDDPNLSINPTAVRVPVYVGHSAAVHIETIDKISKDQALSLLKQSPSIRLYTGDYPYPTPAHDAAGNNEVHVGRVREDISHGKGLNMWVVSDNLRKGAALNAIQITHHLIERNFVLC